MQCLKSVMPSGKLFKEVFHVNDRKTPKNESSPETDISDKFVRRAQLTKQVLFITPTDARVFLAHESPLTGINQALS